MTKTTNPRMNAFVEAALKSSAARTERHNQLVREWAAALASSKRR